VYSVTALPPVVSFVGYAVDCDTVSMFGASGGMFMSRPPMIAPQQMVHASNAMLPNAAPLVCTLPVLSMLPASIMYKCKKLNTLKHPVRTTVAGSHN